MVICGFIRFSDIALSIMEISVAEAICPFLLSCGQTVPKKRAKSHSDWLCRQGQGGVLAKPFVSGKACTLPERNAKSRPTC
jgi:hypothetical protein